MRGFAIVMVWVSGAALCINEGFAAWLVASTALVLVIDMHEKQEKSK